MRLRVHCHGWIITPSCGIDHYVMWIQPEMPRASLPLLDLLPIFVSAGHMDAAEMVFPFTRLLPIISGFAAPVKYLARSYQIVRSK